MAVCANEIGSYRCDCVSGYEGDGLPTTYDVDGFITAIDTDGSVSISLAEFTTWWGNWVATTTGEAPNASWTNKKDNQLSLYDANANRLLDRSELLAGQTNATGCEDVNECAPSYGAGCEQFCNNCIGSFNCSCAERFVIAANGRACDDLDECADDNGSCGSNLYFLCANNYGVAQTCSGGYPAHPTGLTSDGPYRDCQGDVFTDKISWLGDGWCDDGTAGANAIDFNCSLWHNDHGDC